MKPLSNKFAEAYASWFSSVFICCGPLATFGNDKSDRSIRDEKPQVSVVRDQPAIAQAPWLEYEYEEEPTRQTTRSSTKERVRKSFSSTRTSLSVRKRFGSNSNQRHRPQISNPSNFRHIYSESFQFPEIEPPARTQPPTFRPLQLSIYQDDRRLTPILPLFSGSGGIEATTDNRVATPPPVARLRGARVNQDDEGHSLRHERSHSSLSFHLPRRPVPEDSPRTIPETPPQIPPRSRARAYTSPESERLAERIASALLEKEKLQQLIDEVVERQSIYLSSRPTTAHSMASMISSPGLKRDTTRVASQIGFESMPALPKVPAIPALPPSAPSFAERLNPSSDRPSTAPTRSPVRPHRQPDQPGSPTTPRMNTPTPVRPSDPPVQPPLPLVLRPPLRKKKSFSRVSHWLSLGEHTRDLSFDSVTNQPRPVRDREGFYQIAASSTNSRRASVSSTSSWETEDDERTMPTTWSPSSSPAAKTAETVTSGPAALDRMGTFGSRDRPTLTPARAATASPSNDVMLMKSSSSRTVPGRDSVVGIAF